MTLESRTIVDGPNREKLFDALRLRSMGIPVQFDFAPAERSRPTARMKVVSIGNTFFVNAIEAASEDGDDWNVTLQGKKDGSLIDIYYSTRSRTGEVQVPTRPDPIPVLRSKY